MSLKTRMIVAASITAVAIFAKTRIGGSDSDYDFDSDESSHSSGHRSAEWSWRGTVPEGQWARIRNVNGAIKVEGASGDELQVVATKRWSRGNPDHVRIVTSKDGGDVTVCALYGRRGRCGDDNYKAGTGRSWLGSLFRHKSDVSVMFKVAVPRGVKLDATTVNGEISILGVGESVKASTVNGGIKATTSRGPLDASTVNGSIMARIDSLSGDAGVSLSTVNGSVVAELPEQINAVIDLSTVNGRFTTDFPIGTTGSKASKRVHAVLGAGGPELKLSTVNGSVTLKKTKVAGHPAPAVVQ